MESLAESFVTSHIHSLSPGHLPKTVQSLLKPHSPLILGITYLEINPDSFKAKLKLHWKSTVHPGINGSLSSSLIVCWSVKLFCVWDAVVQTLEPEITCTFVISLQHNSCRIHLFACHLEPPGICYFPSASLTVSHCLWREHAVFYKSLAFIQFYCIILLNLWKI